jgi:hypothetical protein
MPSGETRAPVPEATAIAAFLRALAARAERDADFAASLAAAMAESGLLARGPATPARATARAGAARREAESSAQATPTVDPFAALRQGGEAELRAALAPLGLAMLHDLVRTHRLDPARISARWSSRERLTQLIVTQVRARADHGKAFARV